MSNELSLPHGVMEGKRRICGLIRKTGMSDRRLPEIFACADTTAIDQHASRNRSTPDNKRRNPCSSRTTNRSLTQLSKLLLSYT
jgi:hypothetical protein